MNLTLNEIKTMVEKELYEVLYEKELEEAFLSGLALLASLATSPAEAGVEGYPDFTTEVAEAYAQVQYNSAVDARDTDEALKYGKALEDLKIVNKTEEKESFKDLNDEAQAMLKAADTMVKDAVEKKDKKKFEFLQGLIDRAKK